MRAVQGHTVLAQGGGQRVAQLPVVVVADRAEGALGVDDHRHDGVGARGARDLGEVADLAGQGERQVDTHDGAHLTAFE